MAAIRIGAVYCNIESNSDNTVSIYLSPFCFLLLNNLSSNLLSKIALAATNNTINPIKIFAISFGIPMNDNCGVNTPKNPNNNAPNNDPTAVLAPI